MREFVFNETKDFKRASNSHAAPATIIIIQTSHKPTYENKFNVGQKNFVSTRKGKLLPCEGGKGN